MYDIHTQSDVVLPYGKEFLTPLFGHWIKKLMRKYQIEV